MSTISLRLPESLHNKVRELAKQDGVSVNQFATSAIAEKLAALMTGDYIEQRASRGSRSAYEGVLSKVGSADPEPQDSLP